MIAQDVPVLKPGDTGNQALTMMEENFLKQLPVVSEDDYIALVSEKDLLEWDQPEQMLSESDMLHFQPIIMLNVHPYDALNTMHQLNLSVLPVLDHERKYFGSVTKDTLLKYIAENNGTNAPGGIIVLEILPRNYTLFEIARICENEDVIITNASLRSSPDGMLEVTLKLNRAIVDPVVASFERHNYVVKEVFGSHRNDEDLTDNYNLLMNYLDM